MDLLYNQIEKIAHWPMILALVVAAVLGGIAFDWRNQKLGVTEKTFDGRFWYTPDEGKQFLESIGKDGQGFYAATQLTLDMIFPIVYGTLFATLIVYFHDRPWGSCLLALPLLAVGFDFLENFTTTYLALSFDGKTTVVTRVAVICTSAKWVCLIATVLVIVSGTIALQTRQIWRA